MADREVMGDAGVIHRDGVSTGWVWGMSSQEVLLRVGSLFPWAEPVFLSTPGGGNSYRGPSLQLFLL